jgi:hypothetical protein
MSGGLPPKHGRKRNSCLYGGVAEKPAALNLATPCTKKDEAPERFFDLRQALHAFLQFLHQFSVFSFCSRRFPPIRSPFYVKLSWGLNYPSPFWLEELHANGKAFALQWLAVSHPAFGAKLTRARSKHQRFAWFPAARTDNPRATRANILGKSRFRTGRPAMAVNEDGDFHRDALFGSIRHEFLRMRHVLVHAHRQAAMRVRF